MKTSLNNISKQGSATDTDTWIGNCGIQVPSLKVAQECIERDSQKGTTVNNRTRV